MYAKGFGASGAQLAAPWLSGSPPRRLTSAPRHNRGRADQLAAVCELLTEDLQAVHQKISLLAAQP